MNHQMHTESTLSSSTSAHRSAKPLPNNLNGVKHRGAKLAAQILTRLFQRYPANLSFRLWDGSTLHVGADRYAVPESRFTLVFKNPHVVCSAVLGHDPLVLAEAFFRGDLDIEGDFFAALGIKDHLSALQLSRMEQIGAALTALKLRWLNSGTL